MIIEQNLDFALRIADRWAVLKMGEIDDEVRAAGSVRARARTLEPLVAQSVIDLHAQARKLAADMAESELAGPSRPSALARRIPDWQFKNPDARVKLARLYTQFL